MNKFLKWWQTEKFPEIHLLDNTSFVKKWFFHPIKRRVARLYLKFLQRFTNIKVIAITGSAGKTSVKEFLNSILKIKGKTVVSIANIDPIYNIPTTILKTPIGTKYLVLEMGIEYPMEMDFYLWLVKPNIGVITNIFPTHLKFLGTIKGVLEEKSKLVKSLVKNDIAVLQKDDRLLKGLANKIKAKILWVPKAKNPFTQNGYFAAHVADLLGFNIDDINKGLDSYKKPEHRMNWIELKSGAIVFDDTYNSNPQAVLSVLNPFLEKSGDNEKVAVIGDMLELGEGEENYHRIIGKEFAKYDFQAIIGVGKLSKYILEEVEKDNKYTKTYHTLGYTEALKILKQYLVKDFYIFVKGSHSVGLDKLIDKLV